MSTKTQMYSELAEKASKELTHSVNEWCLFLKSQAKLYKYPYADQLMIYAQRPDASLCLTFDDWTQTMNRYIHKGAKGIGLVDYSGDAPESDSNDGNDGLNGTPKQLSQPSQPS